jgi:hypothetical protein
LYGWCDNLGCGLFGKLTILNAVTVEDLLTTMIRYSTNDGHKLVEVTSLTRLEALPQTSIKVDGHVTLVIRGVDD